MWASVLSSELRRTQSRKLEEKRKRTVSVDVGSVHLRQDFLSVCSGHKGQVRTHRARSAVQFGSLRTEIRHAPTQETKWH